MTTSAQELVSGIANTEYTEAPPERAKELLEQVTEADDAPVVAPRPPVDEFELTAGWLDSDGVLHNRIRVRELNGEDEEELARPAQRTLAKYMDTVINRCVVEMAGKNPTPEMLGDLLIGDRDAIVLAVRALTYGTTTEMPLTCPECKHGFDILLDLEADIPVKELPGDPRQRQRVVDLPKGGVAEVNLMTGYMQLAAWDEPAEETNVSERESIILRHAVYSIRGIPITSMHDVRKLSSADRRAIMRYLDDNTCGPQWQGVKQECPNCLVKFPIPLNLVALFW